MVTDKLLGFDKLKVVYIFSEQVTHRLCSLDYFILSAGITPAVPEPKTSKELRQMVQNQLNVKYCK